MSASNRFPLTNQDSAAIKFDLFVKLRELRQVSEGLRAVLALPEREKQAWIEDNEEFLSEMIEAFLQETMTGLDGLALDSEGLELSVELVSVMRDAMAMVQSMTNRRQPSWN